MRDVLVLLVITTILLVLLGYCLWHIFGGILLLLCVFFGVSDSMLHLAMWLTAAVLVGAIIKVVFFDK